MSDSGKDDFYVGYSAVAPANLARFVRRWVVVLCVLAIVSAVVLVMAQGRFAQAWFEFGNTRSFEGYVSEHPYPTLLVRRPGPSGAALPFSRYLLAAFGKHGAQKLLSGLDGQRVQLEGTLIYRDDQTMIEVVAGSVQTLGADRIDPAASNAPTVGRFTLTGEIIDSKCYLGVMKPGNLKPHRSCAIRCISGGIPPIFVARDESGAALHLLMIGGDGRTLNKEVLDFVADPIELDGEIVRDSGLLVLRTEPTSFRRRR